MPLNFIAHPMQKLIIGLAAAVVIAAAAPTRSARTDDVPATPATPVSPAPLPLPAPLITVPQPAPELLHEASGIAAPVATAQLVQPRVLWMVVTAYCPCTKCCGPNAQGLTASGHDVSYNGGRFVAADTTLLPFGAHLRIPGYSDHQPVEVIDRGSAIKGNRLDVFFPTHDQALAWGRQRLPVIIDP